MAVLDADRGGGFVGAARDGQQGLGDALHAAVPDVQAGVATGGGVKPPDKRALGQPGATRQSGIGQISIRLAIDVAEQEREFLRVGGQGEGSETGKALGEQRVDSVAEPVGRRTGLQLTNQRPR